LLGVFLSAYGEKSIKAANKATTALKDLFHLQFDGSVVESYNGHPTDHMFCVNRSPLMIVPSVVGGGSNEAADDGFHMPRNMPRIMKIGWFFSILYFFIDISINKRYILGILPTRLGGQITWMGGILDAALSWLASVTIVGVAFYP